MPNGDLAFAKVSPSSLAKLSNREVLQVHKRFAQSWRKREIMSVPLEGLSREDFLNRFAFMVAELKKRELDRPDAGPLDDALARQNPRQEADQPPLSEAFHLRDTHWVDVPESGTCPVSHPTKARFPGKEKQVCFTRSAATAAAQARMREQEELSEGIRPAFGSPGGKKYLAHTIVSLIPDHQKYVEPFIGGGAVFFAKKESPSEVINDKHVGVAHAYRFIKNVTESQIAALKRKPLEFSRPMFFRMRDSKPGNDLDRFHRFMYLNAFSFGKGGVGTITEEAADGRSLVHKMQRLPRIAERLKKVGVLNEDFRSVISRNDGPSTFFYLDPPYPTQQGNLKTDLTNEDILKVVEGIKGKFILSLPNDAETRKVFNRFHKKFVMVRRTMNMATEHNDPELLISNFPLKSSDAWLAESSISEQALDKIPEAEVNLRLKDFPTMKCAECRYFVAGAEPGVACKIVTRAEPELVCNAYQGAERKATYEVADEDWLAFTRGMAEDQPYQHIVQRGFMTPEGPIVIIRDTMKPKPHVFSLSKEFHLEHTGQGEHQWQQSEVDRIIGIGKQGERSAEASDSPFSDRDLFWGPVDLTRPSVNDKAKSLSESFRIDLTYKPDEEPTHEQLEERRAEILKKFEDFVKAEFPKGEIKVELENLIPREQE